MLLSLVLPPLLLLLPPLLLLLRLRCLYHSVWAQHRPLCVHIHSIITAPSQFLSGNIFLRRYACSWGHTHCPGTFSKHNPYHPVPCTLTSLIAWKFLSFLVMYFMSCLTGVCLLPFSRK